MFEVAGIFIPAFTFLFIIRYFLFYPVYPSSSFQLRTSFDLRIPPRRAKEDAFYPDDGPADHVRIYNLLPTGDCRLKTANRIIYAFTPPPQDHFLEPKKKVR